MLWEKRYNGPDSGPDLAGGLAVGPNGSVAVTGTSQSRPFSFPAYDYSTVLYQELPSPLFISLIDAGALLRFTGKPGDRYYLQRAFAITGPWDTIVTATAPANGAIEHIDAPLTAMRFYRLEVAP